MLTREVGPDTILVSPGYLHALEKLTASADQRADRAEVSERHFATEAARIEEAAQQTITAERRVSDLKIAAIKTERDKNMTWCRRFKVLCVWFAIVLCFVTAEVIRHWDQVHGWRP